MIDPFVLLAFLPAGLALNLTPGADMMFCLAQGAQGGSRPAWAASAGISTGSMVHVTVAGLGLGALISQYPLAFDVIRWVGVAYLLWLAWRALKKPLGSVDAFEVRAIRAFWDGFAVNMTNPKVILFILAFVPQFVDPSKPILLQFWVFGLILAIGGFFINGFVGYFAGGIGRKLASEPKFARILGYVTATIFGALAVRLALEARRG